MTITKDEAKRYLTEYVNKITVPDERAGRNNYKCPLCGSGTHGHKNTGAFHIDDEGILWHCAACDEGGDVFTLIGKVEGLPDYPSQKRRFEEIFNVEIDDTSYKAPQASQAAFSSSRQSTPTTSEKADTEPSGESASEKVKEIFANCCSAVDEPSAKSYLNWRGFTDDTIIRAMIAYKSDQPFYDDTSKSWIRKPAILFPYGMKFKYYTARSIDGKLFYKPNERDFGKEPIFNEAALYQDQPCFVCEGQIDALSIMQAGGKAIAIGGKGTSKLINRIKEKEPAAILVLSLDNDDPGREAQAKLADELDKIGVKHINAVYSIGRYPDTPKDANDMLRLAPSQLTTDVLNNIRKAEQMAKRPDNVENYILYCMDDEIDRIKKDMNRKTGFTDLDREITCLYSGLYVIGGTSSVGKTTFVNQACDQMAASGQHVLFFSLEQSRLELVSKSISRRTLIDGGTSQAVTSTQIRLGANNGAIVNATDKYIETVGDRLSIIEGNFNCNVQFIENYTAEYIKQNNTRPVVVVDYLQILSAAADPDTGRKSTDPRVIVNENITALKRISRNYDLPVIVLSSINRTNYLTPLDFESFKESGAIEYSCDVVLGLQFSVIHDELFDKDDVKSKRDKITEEKNKSPREVELVCLKNRYGKSNFTCNFKYYPEYDYFKGANDDFTRAGEEAQYIFDADDDDDDYMEISFNWDDDEDDEEEPDDWDVNDPVFD